MLSRVETRGKRRQLPIQREGEARMRPVLRNQQRRSRERANQRHGDRPWN